MPPNIFGKKTVGTGQNASGKPPKVQNEATTLTTSTGEKVVIFIESVMREADRVFVLGWSSAPTFTATFETSGFSSEAVMERHARDDVAASLSLPTGLQHGFALLNREPIRDDPVEIVLNFPDAPDFHSGPLVETGAFSDEDRARFTSLTRTAIPEAAVLEVGTTEWYAHVAQLPTTAAPHGYAGNIEEVLYSDGGGLVVSGWAVAPDHTQVWIEDQHGHATSLETAFRRWRGDLAAATKSYVDDHYESEFTVKLAAASSDPSLRLRMITDQGIATLANHVGARLLASDPETAARKLFGNGVKRATLRERIRHIDLPMLAPIMRKQHDALATSKPRVRRYGAQPETPEVTVIVALCHRYELLEPHVTAFSQDPESSARIELVFIGAEPAVDDKLLEEARRVSALFDLPFRLVMADQRLHRDAAHGLGLAEARGKDLVFLSGDVLPSGPGWLAALNSARDAHPDVGIVGARLVAPDGALVSEGLTFEFVPGEQIWRVRSPRRGTPPVQPAPDPHPVPAVGGKVILVARDFFDELGGWPVGYLFGEGSDIDLCLRARAAGQSVFVAPRACFVDLGTRPRGPGTEKDFSEWVKMVNATTLHDRWHEMMESDATRGEVQ